MEINAHELRIGNLFQERQSKEVIMVTELSIDKIGFSGSFKKGWQAEPIPLTEEWLVKFGVKGCFLDVEIFENKTLRIDFNSVEDLALWISEDEDTLNELDLAFNLKQIKYIHELQNLYFCLTKQELTISK